MAGEWTQTTIGELVRAGEAHLQTGPFGTALKAAEYSQTGVPLISVGEVREGYFHVTTTTPRVSAETTKRLPKFVLQSGDIVFGRKGSIDRNAMIGVKEEGWFLGSDGIRLRLAPTFDCRFFSFQMRNPATRAWLLQNGEGSTMPSLNQGILERLPVTTPPLPEQKRIAHILGTLDDKIELNRRMNATLEGVSRAIFKSWFVDFDPVRQKAAGKQPVGMDSRTAALFPDSFEDSEIGEVPTGWRVGTVCDYADLNPESWSKATYPDEVRYVDLSSTKWGEVEAVERYGRESAPSRAQRILRIGDTIFGTVRPGNGSFAFVEEDGLTGSTGFAVIRPKRREWREYVYVATTQGENVERLAHLADGGAYPAVRPEVVAATPIVDAPLEVVERFSDCTSACFTRIIENRRESRTLAALRDTLLPKLLSGELRVPEAEGMVEEAVS